MALYHSPRIPTDGLVLCLDPANPKSYPRSGSTCYDLSKNGNHATLYNTATFSTENNGIFKTQNSSFIGVPHSSSLNLTSGLSIGIWVRFSAENSSYFKTIFGKPNFGTYGLIVEWYGGNGILSDFITSGNRNLLYYLPPTPRPILNQWIFLMSTYQNNGQANNTNLYHYDRLRISRIPDWSTSVSTRYSTGNIDLVTEDIRIADGGSLPMDIGPCYLYNRGLSKLEVLNVFNSTRSRFGI